MKLALALSVLVVALACPPPTPPPTDPPAPAATAFDDVKAKVDAFHAAHPGEDGDINADANPDADAAALLATCGDDQRPVFPILAWEHGGADHAWVNAAASALLYCVYTPVSPSSAHWSFDPSAQRVTADVYVAFPDENPCKDEAGRDQVAGCIGDDGNFEILVDTASFNDGRAAGLDLSEASTLLQLVLADGTRVELHVDE